MKIGTSAAIGFTVGASSGFIGYWVVFIFSDNIQTAALRLDVEESHILLFVMIFCAAWGSIVCTLFALAQAGKRRAKRSPDTSIATMDNTRDNVWPPAPRP